MPTPIFRFSSKHGRNTRSTVIDEPARPVRAGRLLCGVLTQSTLGAWRTVLTAGARDGSGSMAGGPPVSDSSASAGNTPRRWTRTPPGRRLRRCSPWVELEWTGDAGEGLLLQQDVFRRAGSGPPL